MRLLEAPAAAPSAAPEVGETVRPATGSSESANLSGRRPRLEHVDAMRPLKQLGVVTTHAFAYFAPAAGIAVGASVLVTHVTRFAFMFISAGMLVYAYPVLTREGAKTFWRRRLLAVGLPYVTWTAIYFFINVGRYSSTSEALSRFAYYLGTGFYQLYFLLLLLELCVVYPAFLWLLRRTERHHVALFASSLGLQLVIMSMTHWGFLAGYLGKGNGMLELWNYQLFVVAGGLLAWHYETLHRWLGEHRRSVIAGTAVALVLAEGSFVLAETGVVPGLGGTNPAAVFQPATMPAYLGLVLCIYLVGMSLVERARRSPKLAVLLKAGVDDSYGIYLSQIVFFQLLVLLGWRHLDASLTWPVVTLLSVPIVFLGAAVLTSLLARLPGARALAGRPREPWRSLVPHRVSRPGSAIALSGASTRLGSSTE